MLNGIVGQGALNASESVMSIAEKIKAPVIKALLGKAVIPDDHPNSLGGIGMLGTYPSLQAMNESDTLLMIGTSFPYVEYLPKPGKVRGIQIDIKPERIGLRYPVEVGLVGDSAKTLLALLPMLLEKNDESVQSQFLQSKQQAMKKWNDLLAEQSGLKTNASDKKMVKPQSIAAAVSSKLEDESIVSVDSGTNTLFAARFINLREGMKFSLSGTLASMACGLPYAIAVKLLFLRGSVLHLLEMEGLQCLWENLLQPSNMGCL